MYALEHLRLVSGEERGEEALGGAPPTLELARGAGLAGAVLEGHSLSPPLLSHLKALIEMNIVFLCVCVCVF